MQLIRQVKEAVAEVLELEDSSELTPETRLEHDLGFDSALYIELIMLLEDRFENLSVDPANLHREDFFTIGRTAGFIGKKLQSAKK